MKAGHFPNSPGGSAEAERGESSRQPDTKDENMRSGKLVQIQTAFCVNCLLVLFLVCKIDACNRNDKISLDRVVEPK